MHRILALTNYYPSLIQLFCKELLSFLVREHTQAFEVEKSPPRIIQSSHVDEAYRSENLRKQIRDRFVWTLQLDQRYEVIAYAMALEQMDHASEGQLVSSIGHLRELALYWWPDGFKEKASQDEFRSLLEEMVGLGVLRASEGIYAFRNATVLRLVGTRDEIENMLQQGRELPTEFTPTYGRGLLKDDKGKLRLSVLTAEQENEFRKPESSVILSISNPLATYSSLQAELKTSLGKTRIWIGDTVFSTDRSALRKEFEQRLRKLEEGVTVVLFGADYPWNLQILQECLEVAGRARMAKYPNRHVHISFSAEPSRLWQLLESNPRILDIFEEDYIRTISQSKWHDTALRTWIDEQSEYSELKDPLRRKVLSEKTGNWPFFIYRLDEYFQKAAYSFDRALEAYDDSWATFVVSSGIATKMGFTGDGDIRTVVLRKLIEMEEAGVTEADLADITQASPEKTRSVLEWASRLGYIGLAKDLAWQVDPIVRKILTVHTNA